MGHPAKSYVRDGFVSELVPFAQEDRSVLRGRSDGGGKVAQGLERFAGRT